VTKIYSAVVRTENLVQDYYPDIIPQLPDTISFFHSEDLASKYPDLSPRERETVITREHGAVFVIGIGGELPNGEIHDGRAPDYDDWNTESRPGYKGLNGDIIIWNSMLDRAFEISSMGIRVDKPALLEQLKIRKLEKRKELYWHQLLLNDKLPLSIGGGIGESRLCMYFLRKAHIGEIQSSIWPETMVKECRQNGIHLL
jgi:aspartate--ammonia ligase